ncbi:MAG: carboxymuconolactone decarboxylase family protein [Armatimonadetes bacterium]|nr:carboxymuconolactone decarboxylase family protein [Armatimonadota bacterium]
MAHVSLIEEAEATGKVKEIYEDIKRFWGIPYVPNSLKAMGHNPEYLEANWNRIKVVLRPQALDERTVELIGFVVATLNHCPYFVDTTATGLKRMGFSERDLLDIMAVVEMFDGLNRFTNGLAISVKLD